MDYKKYSLEQLENWMHDAMSCGDATPQEIYDVIIEVVKDNYYIYKKQASEAYELLSLLNGNGEWTVEEVLKEKEYYEPSMPPWGHSDLEYGVNQDKILSCDKDDKSPECQKSWNDFWGEVDEKHSREYNLREAEYYNQRAQPDAKRDKVVKWQLPVEIDGLTGDCIVQFPDDLLEAANLKEGDTVEWVDQGNGSYLLRKV
jgi:hypothetical protein